MKDQFGIEVQTLYFSQNHFLFSQYTGNHAREVQLFSESPGGLHVCHRELRLLEYHIDRYGPPCHYQNCRYQEVGQGKAVIYL